MRRSSILVLSAGLLLAACGKKGGNSGLLVPKDASIVVHINSSSLSSKLSWDEIKQTNWFREMNEDTRDTLARQLMADPSTSGIDTKGDLVFFMKRQGQGGYLVFEGKLKDAGAFESMLKNMKKEDSAAQVRKDGDYSYMTSDDGVVLWDKSKFAYIANSPMPSLGAGMMGRREGHPFLNDSLRLFAKQTLTLKGSDNLDGDSRFADLVKDNSDIHLWMNAQGYLGETGDFLSMMKFNVLFEGNVSATSMNFENGKIAVRSKQFYGEEMSRLVSKYRPSNVSADLINRIPSQNVAAVFAFNYPPDGLKEFLKVVGADGMANGFLSKMNYSVDEFIKANKGDILLAISDVTMVTKQDTLKGLEGTEPNVFTSTKPDMKVLFATSVNDKAAFDKLVTLAWNATKDQAGAMPSITYKLENNWFAASNSPEYTAKFLAGGDNKLPFTSKIAGHPFGMYIDLNKLIQSLGGPMAKSENEKAALDASLKVWQDIVGTGGEYSDKSMRSQFEINLVDKNTNSLKQLNQYFDKLASLKRSEKKMEGMATEPVPDTLTTTEAPK